MRELWRASSNTCVFLIVTILLANIQVSFWWEIFGNFPAPMLWLPTFVYLSLYRQPTEGILTIYLLCLPLASMSAIPLGLLGLVALAIFVGAVFLKQRIYWNRSGYFVIVCAGATVAFHILHWLFSLAFETNPVNRPDWVRWTGEIILTPLISGPMFPFFQYLDKLTNKVPLIESSGEVI